MSEFEFAVKQSEFCNMIYLKGCLDFRNSNSFYYNVSQSIDFSKTVIFDLQNFEFIDSAGIGVFLKLTSAVNEKNLEFYCINIQQKVFQIFNMVGLSQKIKTLDIDSIKNILKEEVLIG